MTFSQSRKTKPIQTQFKPNFNPPAPKTNPIKPNFKPVPRCSSAILHYFALFYTFSHFLAFFLTFFITHFTYLPHPHTHNTLFSPKTNLPI